MAFITNGGAKLIQRAVQENKAIEFGSVRMNSIYESNPAELVQKSDSWFGANVGEVVGCLSHVSVDDVPCVRDAKIAIQCNDNSKPWKSIGIYAHLEGEDDELLFACESIQNGDYKNVTIVELPVTLDGAVEDFGLSEGGGGGVPENMMTTNTNQEGLAGTKTWSWVNYDGSGSEDEPQDDDKKTKVKFSIDGKVGTTSIPLTIDSEEYVYDHISGWTRIFTNRVFITSAGIGINGSYTSWDNLIRTTKSGATIRADSSIVEDDGEGNLMIFGQPIEPDSTISVGGLEFTIDGNGCLTGVSCISGIATISVVICDYNYEVVEKESGVSVVNLSPLLFQSPIQLLEGYGITCQATISYL